MNRLLLALALYLGLGFFFVINAMAILRGAPMLIAIGKAFVALVMFALLGVIAGFVTRVKPAAPVRLDEPVDTPSVREVLSPES